MPNRIIKESINESRSLSELSFFAEDLFKRLITYADDYGRFNADYQIILARLYPREIQIVNESDIEDALIELSGAGKIGFYTSNPRKEVYGCFPNWSDHQRVRNSKKKFPDPEDTSVNDWYLRRFIPVELKRSIIERDGFKCKICGKYISTIQDSRRLIKMGAGLYHIDHIVPVEQGGRATNENLQLTCAHCNLSRKKKFSFDEIVEMSLRDNEVAASCGELRRVADRIQSESESESESEYKHGAGNTSAVPTVISLLLNDKSLHDVYQSDIDAWAELYPSVDIMQELRKMKGWLEANPTKRKTKRGIGRFINSWLARTQDSGGSKKDGKSAKKNSFNSFPQREYDFDELERKLLGGG